MFRPTSLFVDRNNTVYVIGLKNEHVREWRVGSTSILRTKFTGLSNPRSLFVTTNGTIYVDNGEKGTVEKWALDAEESAIVMSVKSSCRGLFVDIVNSLYCSLFDEHQVVRQSLNTSRNISKTVIAGTGFCGSTLNMVCSPRGIFVTIKLALYVADCGNDRIQLYESETVDWKKQ